MENLRAPPAETTPAEDEMTQALLAALLARIQRLEAQLAALEQSPPADWMQRARISRR
jgi:BMFP domain-containing protein YqiC